MLKILKRCKWVEWVLIIVCLSFISLQVFLELKIPDYTTEITMILQTPNSHISEIWKAGGFMLICAFGSLLAAIVVGFFASRIAAALSFRLRGDVYDKVNSFSMEEISGFSIASLITRSTNDITQVQMLIAMGLQVLIKAPIMAVWAIIKISGKGWQWSIATATSVFVLVCVVMVLVIFALPKFKIVQKLTDNLNRVTRENLTGVRVVRAYNAEAYQEEKFDVANSTLTSVHLFISRMMAIMMPVMMLIMNGLSLSIYWIGSRLIDNAESLQEKLVLFSDMPAYSSYAIQVVMSFMMLVVIFIIFPRAQVSANRINEVLDTDPKIKNGNLKNMPWQMGEVEFRNVCFRYPDAAEYILHNISFKAEQGETIAFIGSTGSGKSTLINLIPRFYDATEGEILINGKNIKEYRQTDLHNKIGYVPQKAMIFSGTIRSNIVFGDNGRKPPTNEEVEQAATTAQAKAFIDSLEKGYEHETAQSGTNLSGGQKQRLAIARAIARQPEILIFDDSFSALDYKTDRELREDLARQKLGITTFIVAQRIGTIKNADKILVLDEGVLVGMGKHNELLKNCKVYQEIAYSQLSKEELDNG